MEFKFRAVDDSTPPFGSSSSPMASTSYIPEQGLHLQANSTTAPNLMQSQRDFCTIQREIEKERIRQEIIAAESMHRRVLEEEVRRELMVEREMAMHRASRMGQLIDWRLQSPKDFYIIQREIEERIRQEILAAETVNRRMLEEELRRKLMMEREMVMHRTSEMGLLQFLSRYPLMHQLSGGLAFPGNCGLGFGYDALPPMLPRFSCAVRDESKSALEVNRNDRLISLPRPEPNISGTKQNASTPPAGSGEPPAMSSKTQEWNCALCQVSASSAKGLHNHLQGKKHKAKEALLRAQNICKNSSELQQKKPGKQIKVTESRDTADTETETKVVEESLQAEKTVGYSNQKKEDSKNKIEELPKQKDLNAENQENKNEIPTENKGKTKRAHRKKLKLKVDAQSLQAEKTTDFSNQKKEDSKNENEPPKQKDMNAENQKNENGMPAVKREKSKQAHKKKLKLKVDEDSPQAEKTAKYSNLQMENSKNKNEEPPKQKYLNLENQKKKNGMITAKKGKTTCRKKLKFWCEICQVGAHSLVVMKTHKKGKKHMARLKESDRSYQSQIKTVKLPLQPPRCQLWHHQEPAENTQDAQDIDMHAKEVNKATIGNVTGDLGGSGSSTLANVVDLKRQTPSYAEEGTLFNLFTRL